MPGPRLLEHLRPRLGEMTDVLRGLVEHESPSRDKSALDALARKLADRFGAIGGAVELFENPDGGEHLVARFFEEGTSSSPALLLGHFDTVWPRGHAGRDALPGRRQPGLRAGGSTT